MSTRTTRDACPTYFLRYVNLATKCKRIGTRESVDVFVVIVFSFSRLVMAEYSSGCQLRKESSSIAQEDLNSENHQNLCIPIYGRKPFPVVPIPN